MRFPSCSPTCRTEHRRARFLHCLQKPCSFVQNAGRRSFLSQSRSTIGFTQAIYVQLSPARTLYCARGSRDCSAAQRHKAARRRASQTDCQQPEPARPEVEAKGCQAFRFGPRSKRPALVDRLFFLHLAGDFGPRQTLSNDLPDCQIKAVTVIHILPVVVPGRLVHRGNGIDETARH